ncbi:metallophosphoesterase [Dactylosporangium sp. AC04546]|uniref:metallophosphoesterase family protein n=1 Tax=Dactylosporangium sp. AC04546 TaxID=2862460 RepID=UPI001EE13812|nr:metallophosphoesterase [Dactylosporangium sp. AC04546]WVK80683.1 metallophosphoesterase [Dactylosporangium sp. AC04546]
MAHPLLKKRRLLVLAAAVIALVPSAAQAGEPGHGQSGQETVWRGNFDGASNAWKVETDGTAAGWRGWTFTQRDDWFAAAAPAGVGCDPEKNRPLDQRCFLDQRNQFSRARGVLAVADNGIAAAKGATVDGDHPVNSTLVSPGVPVGGKRAVELVFSSQYRQAHKAVGRVTVAFDGGAEREILRYSAARTSANGGGDVISGQEVLRVDVPARARTAVFRFGYSSNRPQLYWAVDDVVVRTPLPVLARNAKATTFQVLSDIQVEGLPYTDGALELLRRQAPGAKALLLDGDIISGPRDQTQEQQVQEYADVSAAFARHRLPTVLPAIGNHDVRSRVLTREQQQANFLAFANKWGAGIDKTYYEKVVGGVPVIAIGPEAGVTGEEKQDISDAQMAFLQQRLAYWAGQRKQVLVMRHYPFEWTVSGTYGNFYENGPREFELEAVVGKYSNVIYLSGHTHWSPYRRDWAARVVTEGGSPDGYTAINTGALAMEFAPSPDDPWDEDSATDRPESPAVLTIAVYPDRTIVRAFDVLTGEQINQVEVANPAAGR